MNQTPPPLPPRPFPREPPHLIGCWSPRWVEEDPMEILQSVYECMERTCEKLTQLNIDITNIKGAGGAFAHLGPRTPKPPLKFSTLFQRSG